MVPSRLKATYCDVFVIYIVALGSKVISKLGINCDYQIIWYLGFDNHLHDCVRHSTLNELWVI